MVSIAPFSTPACPDCSQNIQKTAVFCMFSLFNISSIFPGGSADPICPYVRTPMCPPTSLCLPVSVTSSFDSRLASQRPRALLSDCGWGLGLGTPRQLHWCEVGYSTCRLPVFDRTGFNCVEVLGRIIRGQSGEVLVWLSVWSKVRQLYDLHIYSMTYTLFFIPDYQFQKCIFMFS